MEKKQIPTHIRIDGDPDIWKALTVTKSALKVKTQRNKVTDKEALRYSLLNNNGNFVDVLDRQMKGMSAICCVHEPKIKTFPFTPLRQTMLHYVDGHISRDDILNALRALNAKAEIVEDKIVEKIKEENNAKKDSDP